MADKDGDGREDPVVLDQPKRKTITEKTQHLRNQSVGAAARIEELTKELDDLRGHATSVESTAEHYATHIRAGHETKTLVEKWLDEGIEALKKVGLALLVAALLGAGMWLGRASVGEQPVEVVSSTGNFPRSSAT